MQKNRRKGDEGLVVGGAWRAAGSVGSCVDVKPRQLRQAAVDASAVDASAVDASAVDASAVGSSRCDQLVAAGVISGSSGQAAIVRAQHHCVRGSQMAAAGLSAGSH